jgi:hypothetical protein
MRWIASLALATTKRDRAVPLRHCEVRTRPSNPGRGRVAGADDDIAFWKSKLGREIAADGGRRHAAEGGTDIGPVSASGDVPCNWRTAAIRAVTESVSESP